MPLIKLEDCERIVIAVNPSGASGVEDKRSDEIGIVFAERLKSKSYALLADYSMRGSPHQWASKAIAYKPFKAEVIVAEKNFGGHDGCAHDSNGSSWRQRERGDGIQGQVVRATS